MYYRYVYEQRVLLFCFRQLNVYRIVYVYLFAHTYVKAQVYVQFKPYNLGLGLGFAVAKMLRTNIKDENITRSLFCIYFDFDNKSLSNINMASQNLL